MAAINAAIQKGVAEKTMLELMNPEAQLPQVYPFAADLYQKELATLQQQSPEVSRRAVSPGGGATRREGVDHPWEGWLGRLVVFRTARLPGARAALLTAAPPLCPA